MVKITYIEASGVVRQVEAQIGHTVMETAVKNDVTGILAECGGACACATCRVYIDDSWRGKVGDVSDMEREMLEFSEETEPSARLSCQISITDDLDGLVVRVPASQQQ